MMIAKVLSKLDYFLSGPAKYIEIYKKLQSNDDSIFKDLNKEMAESVKNYDSNQIETLLGIFDWPADASLYTLLVGTLRSLNTVIRDPIEGLNHEVICLGKNNISEDQI